MKFSEYVVLLLQLVVVIGCSSMGFREAQFSIESVPSGALVSFIEASGNPRIIGKTPIRVTRQDQPGLFDEPLEFEVSENGFQKQTLIVGPTNRGQSKILLKLEAVKNSNDVLNGFAKLHAEVNQMIMKKDLSRAETQAEIMVSQYPSVAVAWDLMGNIYYLQKNYSKALSAYRSSLSIRPDNEATTYMVTKLQRLVPAELSREGSGK